MATDLQQSLARVDSSIGVTVSQFNTQLSSLSTTVNARLDAQLNASAATLNNAINMIFSLQQTIGQMQATIAVLNQTVSSAPRPPSPSPLDSS